MKNKSRNMQRQRSSVVYTALKDDVHHKFISILRPVLYVGHVFGQSFVSSSLCLNIVAKFSFLIILAFMCLVFGLGVFGRGDKIQIWIQLSLYIIPLLTFSCGARIFSSNAYHRLLYRNLTDSFMVRFFVNSKLHHGKEPMSAAHNRGWLQQIALKSILFPMSFEVIQWLGFLGFYIRYQSVEKFVGKVQDIPNINSCVWQVFYYTYWVLSVYLVGFVSFQFVFITRLIVKDTVSLMSLFGNSPFLRLFPVYVYGREHNCCFKVLQYLANFFTMDLLSSLRDEYVYTNCADLSRGQNDVRMSPNTFNVIPRRVLSSPLGISQEPVLDNDDKRKSLEAVGNSVSCESPQKSEDTHMSPTEACEVFTTFIAEVEELTSCFTLFTVVISFFGVANLVAHVSLFAKQDSQHISYWTLFRTILFLLVAVRMLLCVQQVSTMLGKLPAHVKCIRASGKLGHEHAVSPSWADFFELLDSFNLGKRSFGFPLTLRQVASIATFLNMTFLIVLSVFKTPVDHGGKNKTMPY